MHSPAVYSESNGDQDDIIYPCKGCNEILEEGKAFELAGNRWHIDCFRCTSCNTLLDSDANLLLLGDGSLICNNCTYSCSACGDKIEDLAILTGDQSFCASCFRCRNCKNKIENLRYARTTQGIFCMACYETLTQKRRKNRNKQKQTGSNTLNKALPEPPRSEAPVQAFSPDTTMSPTLEKVVEPHESVSYVSRSSRTATSPPSFSEQSNSERTAPPSRGVSEPETLTLPASTYQGVSTPKTASFSLSSFDQGNEADGLFVPLVLDTNPPSASPLTNGRDSTPQQQHQQYYAPPTQSRPSRDYLVNTTTQSSRSSSLERKLGNSPHIAYQEKGRQSSETQVAPTRRSGTAGQSPALSPYSNQQQEFRLQDAPRTKRSTGPQTSPRGSPVESSFDSSISREQNRPSQQVERPRRGDSLAAAGGVPRKMVPNSIANGGLAISQPKESPSSNGQDAFTSPRHPPHPPPNHYEENNDHGVLRKMSNAMRGHTRSVSDRVVPSPRSQRSHASKSPLHGSVDLSSPASPDSREEFLRSQLMRAHQRIADLESARNANQVNLDVIEREVKEKRSTIVVLDAQKELVVRELEVMVDHLRKAKDTNNPLEMNSFKADVLRDFMASVNQLRDSVTSEIEELVQKRNNLTAEITQLIQVKDKGLQEYESLSGRNAQLVQHNNELVQNLQMMGGQKPGANGLGLYLPKDKDKTESPPGELGQLHDSSTTLATFGETDTAIIQTPHLIKMKQQKPTLRKGGLGNALRGLKGAFGSERIDRAPGNLDGMPYSQMETGGGLGGGLGGGAVRTIDLRQEREPKHKFGGFFSSDKNGARGGRPPMRLDQKPMTPVPGQLMDGDLTSRCEFENADIPTLVIRCVQEIEARGMDEEGLYRKSGGKTQITEIAQGFEQASDYDVSDPEIDIASITSLLKQYFRHLTDPLITFGYYSDFINSSKMTEVEERGKAMKKIVDSLPKHHKICLEFIIFHLVRVLAHEAQTKMNAWNIAIVWAPTILRPESIEQELADLKWQRLSVLYLIEQAKDVFDSAG